MVTISREEKERRKFYKSLWNKCWRLMSEYVRRRDDGKCFTCPQKKTWRKMQAGHYFHKVLDFDPININCQCVQCNHYRAMGPKYATKLLNKYGVPVFLDLCDRAGRFEKYTIEEINNYIELYKSKIAFMDDNNNKENSKGEER